LVPSEAFAEEVDALVQRIVTLAEGHQGRLAGLAFEVPPTVSSTDLEHLLTERLAGVGFDFIDLRMQRGPGPLRIVSAEFER
jgi:hypothetical protein